MDCAHGCGCGCADGKPTPDRELGCPHGVGGDVTGEEEKRLGVPLAPDRAVARSHRDRWASSPFDAFVRRDPRVVSAAALAVTALVVAVALGAAPIGGAAAIALLVPAAVVDVEQRRLPDAWVGAALFTLIVTLTLQAAIAPPIDVGNPVGGALAMTLPVLTLHLVSPASMGFGDVKAAAVLGGAVGTVDWRLGAVALCVAALSGAIVGLAMRRRTIAFGPFLVFGAWCSLLGHQLILDGIFTAGATP